MSSNTWQQSLTRQIADGTALANSTTPTSIINAANRFTLPSNLLAYGSGGMTGLRIVASGRISTVVTTPGTLTLEVRFGASTVVFTSGALALNVTAQTNASWFYTADLTLRTQGASTSATILGTGLFTSRALLGSSAVGTAQGVGAALLPDTAPTTGTGFDTTVANTVDFFATWSIANASNSITCHQYELIGCN